jgi:hypothetical protein
MTVTVQVAVHTHLLRAAYSANCSRSRDAELAREFEDSFTLDGYRGASIGLHAGVLTDNMGTELVAWAQRELRSLSLRRIR